MDLAAIPRHQDHQDQDDQGQDRQANMDTSNAHPSPLRSHPWSESASTPAGPGPLRLTSEAPHHDMQEDVQAVQGESVRHSASTTAAQRVTEDGDHMDAGERVTDAQPRQASPTAAATTATLLQPQRHPSQRSQSLAARPPRSALPAQVASSSSQPLTRAAARARPSRSPRSRPPRSHASSSSSSRSPSTSRSRSRYLLASSAASPPAYHRDPDTPINSLPNEIVLHILGFLDVNDLLATSRTSRHLRCLCAAPILRIHRMRYIRAALPPLLAAPQRPSLAELIQRSIFLTNTTVVSRKLARSLVTIRLSHRLAARPPVHVLVERCVLPPACAPGIGHVAPALAARTRAIEREKLKDGLRSWIGAVWQREVGRRSERIRRSDESVGVGKVWRLRKFWERVSRSA